MIKFKESAPILHLLKEQKIVYKKILERFSREKIITLPSDISIVSIMTKDNIENSPLHIQLSNSNIQYFNSKTVINEEWKPQNKPKYIYEVLPQINTKYTIILDGNDVVFVNDINNIINLYKTYNKKIVFGTTKRNAKKYILNTGTCIGETEALKDFYRQVDVINKPKHVLTEHPYVEKVFENNEDIACIDSNRIIFKDLSTTGLVYIE